MSQPAVKRQRNTEMLRAPSVRDVGMSMLLLLAGRASVLGLFPFGVAFFASCFDKSIAYLGITVLSIALMTSAGSAVLTKYLVAALLFWIYTRFRNKENLVLDAACVGGAVMVGGFVFLIYTYVGAYDILMLFVESIVTSLMYIIFKKAHGLIANRKKRTQTAQDELISISVSVGVFITGLSGIVFPYNISLANIVSVYAVLCIALHGGIAAAGSGGLCIGFMSAMSSPSAVVTMGIFGISALFGNLLKSFGRFGVALGFLGGSAVALLYAGSASSLPVTIIETAIGAVLFVLTPNKVQGYIKSYNKDVATLFDEVADRVCEGCPNAVKCWQSDFTRTYRSIMLLLDTIETRGILEFTSVPNSFKDKCLRPDLFVVEFNHVYELYKKNLVRTGEAVTSRDLVARQYKEMSSLMDTMAENICSGFTFREDLEETLIAELDKVGIMAFEILKAVTEKWRYISERLRVRK